ncbi:hypothetical protein HanIR_Chr15g0733561 [Helianthus annuus]|nr:hypothetical protein HanIR_Chr15g0733561 [Helianthus annuus]
MKKWAVSHPLSYSRFVFLLNNPSNSPFSNFADPSSYFLPHVTTPPSSTTAPPPISLPSSAILDCYVTKGLMLGD